MTIYLFPHSLIINILCLLYTLGPIVVRYRKKKKLDKFGYIFVEDNAEKHVYLLNDAIIKSLFSLLFVLQTLVLFSISPLTTNSTLLLSPGMTFLFSLYTGSCIFHTFRLLISDGVNKDNAFDLMTYFVCIFVLTVLVISQENSLLGMALLVMQGSIPFNEINRIMKTRRKCYTFQKVSLLLSVFAIAIFNFSLPLVLYVIPFVLTRQTLLQMTTISVVTLFFAATYFLVHGVWLLKRAIFNAVTEYTRIEILQKCEEKHNVQRFDGGKNCEECKVVEGANDETSSYTDRKKHLLNSKKTVIWCEIDLA